MRDVLTLYKGRDGTFEPKLLTLSVQHPEEGEQDDGGGGSDCEDGDRSDGGQGHQRRFITLGRTDLDIAGIFRAQQQQQQAEPPRQLSKTLPIRLEPRAALKPETVYLRLHLSVVAEEGDRVAAGGTTTAAAPAAARTLPVWPLGGARDHNKRAASLPEEEEEEQEENDEEETRVTVAARSSATPLPRPWAPPPPTPPRPAAAKAKPPPPPPPPTAPQKPAAWPQKQARARDDDDDDDYDSDDLSEIGLSDEEEDGSKLPPPPSQPPRPKQQQQQKRAGSAAPCPDANLSEIELRAALFGPSPPPPSRPAARTSPCHPPPPPARPTAVPCLPPPPPPAAPAFVAPSPPPALPASLPITRPTTNTSWRLAAINKKQLTGATTPGVGAAGGGAAITIKAGPSLGARFLRQGKRRTSLSSSGSQSSSSSSSDSVSSSSMAMEEQQQQPYPPPPPLPSPPPAPAVPQPPPPPPPALAYPANIFSSSSAADRSHRQLQAVSERAAELELALRRSEREAASLHRQDEQLRRELAASVCRCAQLEEGLLKAKTAGAELAAVAERLAHAKLEVAVAAENEVVASRRAHRAENAAAALEETVAALVARCSRLEEHQAQAEARRRPPVSPRSVERRGRS
jgi:hypothetical protein